MFSAQGPQLILKRHFPMMLLLPGDVGVEARAEFGILEERRAMLRAEPCVENDAGEGLRHGGDCLAPLGLCLFFLL